MIEKTPETLEQFRAYIIRKVDEEKESGEKAKIAYIHQILPYLEHLTSEWGEDPKYYIDDQIQASYHSEDWEKLDIIVSDYYGVNCSSAYMSESELRKRFYFPKDILDLALQGKYDSFDEADEFFLFSKEIYSHKDDIRDIRFILITDKKCFTPDSPDKQELPDEENGLYTYHYNIQTLEKIHHLELLSEESFSNVEIDFQKNYSEKIPCLNVNFGDTEVEYSSYLGYIKGDLLAKLYKDYNTKLLEANVRVYLQNTPVNAGIMKTLTSKGNRNEKTRFFAYNNGISATAESVTLSGPDESGTCWIDKIKGLQIVNGGQTTASLFSAWNLSKKYVDGVYVQMKLTVPKDECNRRELNGKIAEYSNTQNQIKKTDFKTSDPYQVAIENLSQTTNIPRQNIHWFYERIRGLYKEKLRIFSSKEKSEKNNPVSFEDEFPSSRVITKTDLSIYYNSWNQLPHYAARGGEKNFKAFLKRIENKNGDIMIKPDVRYYQELIGMAILFISTDVLVADWQDVKRDCVYGHSKYGKGLKRGIVTYTLSLLSYLSKGRFNLIKIWDCQESHKLPKKSIQMPGYLEKVMLELIKFVEREIRAIPEGENSDPGEWIKDEKCWEHLKTVANRYNLSLPDDFYNHGYILTDVEAKEREEWLLSLHSEKDLENPENVLQPDNTETPDVKSENITSPEIIEPKNEQTSNDEKFSAKVSSVKLPEDLAGFLTKSSVMEISKFISQLQFDKAVDEDVIKILQRILAMRKARKRIPAKMIKDVVEGFSVDSQIHNSESDINRDNESSEVENNNIISENTISYDNTEIKSPVFEARSRKGGSGKLIVGENREFILLKGSVIPLIDTPSMRQGLIDKRDKWIADSSIVINQDKITATLAVDIVMHSSSEAAQLITANSTNGKTYWKCNGITLDDYLKKMGIND